MKIKQLLSLLLLLLTLGGIMNVSLAQTAVTVGSQVTDEANIVSGKAYILQSQAAGTGTVPYINDNGTNYDIPMNSPCNESSVYYLISNGDGTWKIKNYYTNRYWGVPVYNQAIASVADEASAGAWSLNFSGGTAYPSAPDAESTVRGLDRSSNKLWGYTTGTGGTKQVKIYEISADEINLTFDKPGSATNNITVNVKDGSGNIVPGVTATLVSTSCTEFKTGSATALSRTTNSVLAPNAGYDNQQNSTITYTFKIDGLSTAFSYNTAALDVYALTGGGAAQGNNGSTVREWSFDVSTGSTEGGVSTYVSSTGNDICTVPDADGDLYHKVWELNGTEQNVTAPIYIKVTLTKTASLGCYAGIGALKLYTTFVDPYTTSNVFTINNTNSNRGALIYNPENPKYVWSSGKSGTFDATNANSQWVICPAGIDGQYYLYNVGAGKFAIPSATSSTASWIFSSDAVAVTFITQNDGTKKIKTVTTDTYAAVSNGYNGPIINYNDVGGNFTITKVDGDQNSAATAAFNKLVDNKTAASAVPASGSDGWYIIRIKTHGTYADKYVYPAASEINYNGTYYPLTFENGANVRPAIDDVTYYTRISNESGNYYWQMPNGKYLYGHNNRFPISTMTKSNFVIEYISGSGFRMLGSSRYAVPYLLSSQYFIGETSSSGNAYYDIYPIDLDAAGLVAWQVLCDNAPESAEITCSRGDVCGLKAVYKNGFFFLPTGVTPESTDFNLDGATNVTVDATAKTVTFVYNPDLAIVEDGVVVEQGWQTAGRDSEVMLLKVTAKPFKNAKNTTLTVGLKDGSAANISTLKLYEANTNSPEIYSTGDGAPTKTEVATATIDGATATFEIGDLAAGTHYYWIGATVSSTATLGAVLDAAVTGIAYQVEGQMAQNLDLTSVGDPADRGAMVFNVRSYPFLPRDNGSRVYRIPAMIVADDGSIVVAADKRYDRYDDIGNSHVIDIVVRRSTDGGKTWSAPVVIAKGENTTANGGEDSRCGFGDPSLVKGKDGKLYCLFAAGNEGYFKGQKGMCMSVSTDNGVTWSSREGNPPVDLYRSGAIKNVNTAGAAGFGLYDYFVTSGRGLYIPEDDILMYLIPAQTMTSETEHTGDSQDYVFYSRDGGESWYFSETPMVQGGDEAKIIQMNDGSLFGSIRKGGYRRFNTATYTKNDDGKTLSFNFGTQWDNSQLSQTHQNNQDVYYYQRETAEGKTDVIIHSMTTGQHANFKLYYSTDQGANWTEFLNVQTKGTRYVTMDKNPANGSLYLFFEDQSLNSAGGHTDYNHYPLNFLEITRDQLVSLIPALEEYNVPEYLKTSVVKNSVYQTGTGCDTYGTFTGTGSGHWARTWTSNASAGVAGLTISTESGYGFDRATIVGTRVMTIKPSADGATDTYTITAPAGYIISSYSIGGAVYTGGTYRITAADGTTTGDITSTTTPTHITVNDVNAASTTFTFHGASQSNWFGFTNFTITLTKSFPLNVVGDASYATLYLPFDVTTTGATKAYYVATAKNEYAQLIATDSEGTEIPANTAVVLVNSDADASTILNKANDLTPVVAESENLLKGTLVPMTLDLSDATNYYSLGRKNNEIGFYKFTGGTITLGANKAYLETPAPGGAVKGFALTFGVTDGIEESKVPNAQPSTVYDLSGRRIVNRKLSKGLYILNGKKVAVQ